MTYGHEKFIKESIDGVLMQECNFDVELIIANDCSPDNSDFIIKEIINSSPRSNWIKYTRHTENKGMQSNFIWAYEQCKGKYIAMCEGDDYWTDPLKLQKQVNFLESNLDYVLCFHKVDVLKPSGKVVTDFITRIPENYESREVFLKKGNYMHTPSVMFRNNLIKFPNLFKFSPEGDFLLYVLLTKYGKIGYMKDVMAIYRYNVGTISRSKNKYFENILKVNMISLYMVDNEKELNLLIQRNLDFALYYYNNLPFKVIVKNILNLPIRVFKKFFI
jgi:glycosyltransferase involved in cell wall biosynthesis